MGGTNDISAKEENEEMDIISVLRGLLVSLSNPNIIVIDIPFRHDLPINCSENKSINLINKRITVLCEHFKNVHLITASKMNKNFFTRHGLHLNNTGKARLHKIICNHILTSSKDHRTVNPFRGMQTQDAVSSTSSTSPYNIRQYSPHILQSSILGSSNSNGEDVSNPVHLFTSDDARSPTQAATCSSSQRKKMSQNLQNDFLC